VKARADFRFDFAIDAAERRVYRPDFGFAWPLSAGGGSRFVFDLSYLERINGRLQGPIDFWIHAGYGLDLSSSVSLEASLTHFCRHLTSIDDPYVLNINELAAALRVRAGGVEAGFGYGRYIGGSPGYGGLMIFSLKAARILIPELSFAGGWKWVDFDALLHDMELSLRLSRGVALFIRSARTYGLPTETFLGLRLSGEDGGESGAGGGDVESGAPKPLTDFRLVAGAYPFYVTHKLLVSGSFRLELMKNESGRFFADLDFDAPVLTGNGFFAQFWPDRMIYRLRADYEKTFAGGVFGAWYAHYDVDMPADNPVAFLASLSTGVALRNEPDFERLEKAIRFEVWGGVDFKYDYDVGLKLGINTANEGGAANVGAEVRWQANSMRQAGEFKIFADFGRAVSVRPFVGIKKIEYAAGGTPGPDGFANRITAGIGLYKWF
jgi:hypothetical protein